MKICKRIKAIDAITINGNEIRIIRAASLDLGLDFIILKIS
jgi:hypothetical protein